MSQFRDAIINASHNFYLLEYYYSFTTIDSENMQK